MKIKNISKPENAVLEKEVRKIQTLANSLDLKDPKQLETDLWNLESKINRSKGVGPRERNEISKKRIINEG